jgi:hypothetical protein
MTAFQYTSPLRPLDIGYISRHAGVAIDWEHTEIGEWTRAMRYAFVAPLSQEVIDGFQLERAF